MITSTKAKLGPWTDEDTGEHLISLKSPWGIVIVAITGIWLSWNTKYIKKIVGNGALWFRIRDLKSKARSENSARAPVEATPLLGSGVDEPAENTTNKTTDPLAKLLKEKAGIRDLTIDCLSGDGLTTGDKSWLALFTITVALLASGVVVGGFFAAKVRFDGPAILASDRCGLWIYDSDRRSEAATRARVLDLEKEERAAQFAKDCYQDPNPVASRCNVLYRPTLPVSGPIYSNDCPFHRDICKLNQTVTFTTPLIDTKDLGFNTAASPKFRRKTACTPLSMEYPFIQNITVDGITTYTYHYGTKHTGTDGRNVINHTYTTSGDPWKLDAPVYDLFAYSYSNGSYNPVWVPHEYLSREKYSTITIIFVSSLRILYEDHSNDPIFPADKPISLPGDNRDWFRNSDPRARPLACIDTIEVCTYDGNTCWDINKPDDEEGETPDDSIEFSLLYASLYKTDTYYSFAKRQGRSLIAQKKVSQYFSLALSDHAWVDEVQNWVQTSLARTSINAWSVASGEDSVHEGEEGWYEVTAPYGNLCGYYKYNPQGYQSLRTWPLLLAVLSLPTLWILSWHWLTAKRRTERSWRWLSVNILGLQSRDDGTGDLSGNDRDDRPPFATGLSHESAAPPVTDAGQVQAASLHAQLSTGRFIGQGQLLSGYGSSFTTTVPGHASRAQIPSPQEQDLIEWEPLVLHKVLYGVWYMVSCLLVFAQYVWSYCKTGRRHQH